MPQKIKREYESEFNIGDKVGYTTTQFINEALSRAVNESSTEKKRPVTFQEMIAYVPQYSYGTITAIIIGGPQLLYNIYDQFDFHIERDVPAQRMKLAPKPN